jgi:hypothetical protein
LRSWPTSRSVHIHFGLFGVGFWAGVVLAGALVAVAVRARDAVGHPAMVVK